MNKADKEALQAEYYRGWDAGQGESFSLLTVLVNSAVAVSEDMQRNEVVLSIPRELYKKVTEELEAAKRRMR